jgi:phosphoglucomutase
LQWQPYHPAATQCLPQGFTVTSVLTAPIAGQKTGTSGLRKKTKEFMSDNYLANW